MHLGTLSLVVPTFCTTYTVVNLAQSSRTIQWLHRETRQIFLHTGDVS